MEQSFEVDGTALDAESFALGVEWGIAWQQAKEAPPFTLSVHLANAERIAAMLAHQGRRFVTRNSRGWTTITVAGLD